MTHFRKFGVPDHGYDAGIKDTFGLLKNSELQWHRIITPEQSLLFDGSNEFLSTARANIDTSVVTGVRPTFSLHAVFKVNTILSTDGVLMSLETNSINRTFSLYSTNNSIPELIMFPSGAGQQQLTSNGGVLTQGTWHTLTMSVNGTSSFVFLDGVDITNSNGFDNTSNYGRGDFGTNWNIGSFDDGSDNIEANIAQMGLIDRNISLAEHISLYNNGCPLVFEGIIDDADVITRYENNASFNGSEIDLDQNSWQSNNMEEEDITNDVPVPIPC